MKQFIILQIVVNGYREEKMREITLYILMLNILVSMMITTYGIYLFYRYPICEIDDKELYQKNLQATEPFFRWLSKKYQYVFYFLMVAVLVDTIFIYEG